MRNVLSAMQPATDEASLSYWDYYWTILVVVGAAHALVLRSLREGAPGRVPAAVPPEVLMNADLEDPAQPVGITAPIIMLAEMPHQARRTSEMLDSAQVPLTVQRNLV